MNDIVAGLLASTVAIKIPQDYDEAHAFLEQLAEAAPDLRWNDLSPLPSFCPHQTDRDNAYYHRHPDGGLMWDSREYLEDQENQTITQYVDSEEVFLEAPDLSGFLNDLL